MFPVAVLSLLYGLFTVGVRLAGRHDTMADPKKWRASMGVLGVALHWLLYTVIWIALGIGLIVTQPA